MSEERVETLYELIGNMEKNQETLDDSDQKVKLKDIRRFMADINFSFLEILKGMVAILDPDEAPLKPEDKELKSMFM